MRNLKLLTILALLLSITTAAATAYAAKTVTIGIVTDGPTEQLSWSPELFKNELLALTKADFVVRFPVDKQLDGGWSAERIARAHQQLQDDPEVDMVLALGYVSSVTAALHKPLNKPTFAPFIMDANFQQIPGNGKISGVTNLNYLSSGADFVRDLSVMNSVASCQNITVFLDYASYTAQPGLIQRAHEVARAASVKLSFVFQRKQNENLAADLPSDVDCVVITGYGRFSPQAMQRIIKTLIDKNIPSYSLLDARLVEQGVLMSEAPASNWQRLARRNALNMHSVLHGELTEEQPVTFERKRRLTINMQTARDIGVSPRYDVLTRAILLNEEPVAQGRVLNLATVAEEALRANLDLRVAELELKANQTRVDEALSTLWPQLDARVGYSRLNDDSTSVLSGGVAEESSIAAVTLQQILYSYAASASVDIERHLQSSRQSLKRQLELDIIAEATTGYLNLLKAQTLIQVRKEDLRHSRKNLELARERQRIGVASPAEVYRWQIRLAESRTSLLSAQAQLQQLRDALNRLLHRPLNEAFVAEPATLEDPRLIVSRKELFDYVNNDRAFKLMGEFMQQQGLEASPELKAVEALLSATREEVKTNERAYWSPTLSLQGELSHVMDEERVAGLDAEGDTDWTLGVNLSLPLYEGGARSARLTGSRLALQQLLQQRDATRERIEQSIRLSLHAISASYPSIQLTDEASVAADKNLKLVTESYSRGAVTILDLLDAQNAALVAGENATSAVFDFLIDLMSLQRSLGGFDFFLEQQQLDGWLEELRRYINE